MKRIIIDIKFNGKEFFIYQEDNEIGYIEFNNSQLSYDIKPEDKIILDQVYDFIKLDKNNSTFCSYIKLNNNDINIYQDNRNNFYSFALLDNGKEVKPRIEDLIMLNSYYNASSEVLFDKEIDKKEKKNKPLKVIKKVLQIGGVTVVVLISAAISYYFLPTNTKASIDYHLGNITKKDLTKENKNYTYEDIEKAIDSNKDIPEKDKDFYKEIIKSEFEENKDYMDIELIIDRLSTLKVNYNRFYTYNPETNEYEYTYNDSLPSSAVAFYVPSQNKINIIEPESYYSDCEIEDRLKESFDFDNLGENENYIKECYFHEINHLLTNNDVLDSKVSLGVKGLQFQERNDIIRTDSGIFEAVTDDLGQTYASEVTMETINELFSQEYSSEYLNNTLEINKISYTDDMPYMYALAEILPPDVLREYKYNDNDSIITEGLLDINSNKDEVYEFITAFKSMRMYDARVWRARTGNDVSGDLEGSDIEIEKAKQEQAENYKKIHDGFEKMYKAKYGTDMSDDMTMLVYLFNTPVLTDEERKKVTDYLNIPENTEMINFEPKGYFSNYYKEKHPNVIYINSDEEKIEISDNNRYTENNSIRHV